MRRCALNQQHLLSDTLRVTDLETYRYLARSLRLRVGDSVEFFDGEGRARSARLSFFSDDQASGEWIEELRVVEAEERGPVPVLALLKGNHHDEAVRVAGFDLGQLKVGGHVAKPSPLPRLKFPLPSLTRWGKTKNQLLQSEIQLEIP